MSGKAVAAADKAAAKSAAAHPSPPPPTAAAAAKPPPAQGLDEKWPKLTVEAKSDPSRPMRAVCWEGKRKVKVEAVPRPLVTDPGDVVIRITSTAICGSDLHLYERAVAGMKAGDVLGHEPMGVVAEVGPDVKTLAVGDRVVACFDVCGCGARCFWCARGLFSSCAASNPSRAQEKLYGQRTAGLLGYSHLTGGWQGGQAEYLRVPIADVNCLKVPASLPEDAAVLLSDILPTAWHACELGGVKEGDLVAIWGAGPVGILAAHCAQHRGARRVILIDPLQWRLDFAKERLPGVETLLRRPSAAGAASGATGVAAAVAGAAAAVSGGSNVLDDLHALCAAEPAGAPDVAIEAVGCHYAASLAHKLQLALQLETDSPEAVNEAIRSVRKGGTVAVIGAYVGQAKSFALGALMEKGLTLRAGQTPVQAYWHDLLKRVESGALDPALVVTHRPPLGEAAAAYAMFDAQREGDRCVKVVLKAAGAVGGDEGEAAAPAPAGSGAGAVEGAPQAAFT